jgi:hypothetical protein
MMSGAAARRRTLRIHEIFISDNNYSIFDTNIDIFQKVLFFFRE